MIHRYNFMDLIFNESNYHRLQIYYFISKSQIPEILRFLIVIPE